MANTENEKKAAAKARAKQRRRPKAGSTNQLAEQNAQLQQGMLNIRQMYDQAVMERESLRQLVKQRETLLMAAVVSSGGALEITTTALASVEAGNWDGFEPDQMDDGVVLVAIPNEEEPPPLMSPVPDEEVDDDGEEDQE